MSRTHGYEGKYMIDKLHKAIVTYLADIGEYFEEDVPGSLSDTREILEIAIEEGYLEGITEMPPDSILKGLYRMFLEDYERFIEGADEDEFEAFPTRQEWEEG